MTVERASRKDADPQAFKRFEEIVQEIVGELRPLQKEILDRSIGFGLPFLPMGGDNEKAATALTRQKLAILGNSDSPKTTLSDAAKANRKFRKSLTTLIEDFEQLCPFTIRTLTGFAPLYRQWPPPGDPYDDIDWDHPDEQAARLLNSLKSIAVNIADDPHCRVDCRRPRACAFF
jgi:hypothetical protein